MKTLRFQLTGWLACGTLGVSAIAAIQQAAPADAPQSAPIAQPAFDPDRPDDPQSTKPDITTAPPDPVPTSNWRECGSHLTPQHIQQMRKALTDGVYDQAIGGLRGAQPWYVPVTLHVVRQSNGTGGLAEERLSTAMNDANAAFASTPLRFVKIGPTRFINSDDFFFNIDTQAEIDFLRMTDVVCGTLNIYFTPNLAREDGDDDDNDPDSLCGISSFSNDPVQGIVMANSCTALDTNHSTFPHEIGHFFNLYHTHETTFGAECVDGSNCSDEGDLLCDTPADPGLSANNMNGSCTYTGSAMDACNGDTYNPQTWNFMSYADPKSCRTAFTGGQHNRALITHVYSRLDDFAWTACGCAWIVWADLNGVDANVGTQQYPFDHIAEALSRTCAGGSVYIKPGYYAEAPRTINQAVTLKAVDGMVTIGG